MSNIPWINKPKIDELAPTDVLMRRTPSRSVKNQEIPITGLGSLLAEYGMHTGVRTGLELSINGGDNTKFDVAAGMGIFVDYDPDPSDTNVTRITRPSPTISIDDPFVNTDTFTYVFLSLAGGGIGIIITRVEPPSTLDDLSNLVFLGQLRHFGGIIVTVDNNAIMAHGSSTSHIAELVFNGGIRLSGGEISPNGANLQVNIDPGIYEQFGRGHILNQNNPNEFETLALTPIPVGLFFKAYVDGTGELIVDPSTNTLDPSMFNEDGLGTLQSISPSNRFTRLRIRLAGGTNTERTNAVVFYYGTESFVASDVALNSPEPTFVEHPDTIQISPVADIAIRGDVIDFTAAIIAGTAVIKFVSRRV